MRMDVGLNVIANAYISFYIISKAIACGILSVRVEGCNVVNKTMKYYTLANHIGYILCLELAVETTSTTNLHFPVLEVVRNFAVMLTIFFSVFSLDSYHAINETDSERGGLSRSTGVQLASLIWFMFWMSAAFTFSFYPDRSPRLPQLIFFAFSFFVWEALNSYLFLKLSPQEEGIPRDIKFQWPVRALNFVGFLVATFAPYVVEVAGSWDKRCPFVFSAKVWLGFNSIWVIYSCFKGIKNCKEYTKGSYDYQETDEGTLAAVRSHSLDVITVN